MTDQNLDKLMWLSNAPWAPTGYGNQTALFTPRIASLGYDVAITAFYGLGGSRLDAGQIPIYPPGFETYGNDIIRANTKHFGADHFISLMDAWVCKPREFEGVKWMPWYPVDSDPLPPGVRDAVMHAHKRIVFSRFGEKMTNDAGLDCDYIPHGVDTNTFKPSDGDEIRDVMKIPRDAFVVGMVAANKGVPSRKAFAPQIAAFAKLREKHNDAILYIHAHSGVHGEPHTMDLTAYAESVGLVVDRDIRFADPYNLIVNAYTPKLMAQIYSMMDVHMLASMGEGFGIPTVEAQACGTPVIVGDWTASGELCFSGWKIPKSGASRWWTPLNAYQYMVHEDAALEALESAYQMKGNKAYRKAARKGALAYDADRVTEKYWKPFLKKVYDAQ
jgi:glycosyltransferase involved in cell wall biosynthesis